MKRSKLILDKIEKGDHVAVEISDPNIGLICPCCGNNTIEVYYNDTSDIRICTCKKFVSNKFSVYPINFLVKMGAISLSDQNEKNGRYVNANFSNPKKHQTTAYQIFQNFKESENRFMKIAGTVGGGKTYLMMASLREIILEKVCEIHKISLWNEAELFNKLKENFGSPRYNEIIEDINQSDWIFFDDFGCAVKTIEGNWGNQTIFDIINRVYSSKNIRKMLITTNLSENDILKIYGDRIASRLKDSIKCVCTGVDLRNEETLEYWKK